MWDDQRDREIDEALSEDDGYREWSETIEQQNQEHQDFVMANYDSFDDFLDDLANPKSKLRQDFIKHGLQNK